MYVLFGLPGVGKTFVGTIFQEEFGFYFYEGDMAITEEMKQAIQTKTVFTDEMRDVFFEKLIRKIKILHRHYPNLVISQMFIKEKYRQLLLQAIPKAQFFLVTTTETIRESRLLQRTEYPLDPEYARIMCRNFEEPEIRYDVIRNNSEGKEDVKEQLNKLVGF